MGIFGIHLRREGHDEAIASAASVPGTVHLIDSDGNLQTQHAQGGKSDIVLVPTPSDDPDDPVRCYKFIYWLSNASLQSR